MMRLTTCRTVLIVLTLFGLLLSPAASFAGDTPLAAPRRTGATGDDPKAIAEKQPQQPDPVATHLLTPTRPSLFHPAFYRQLRTALRNPSPATQNGSRLWDRHFLQDQGMLVVVHILLAGILAFLLRARRRRHADRSALPPLLHHPLAAGLFASTVLLAPCYRPAPAGWLLLLSAAGVLSAIPLLNQLTGLALQRQAIRLLAWAYLASLTLRILTVPEPLYGLCLIVLCGTLILALRSLSVRALGAAPKPPQRFRGLLKIGMAGLLLIALARVAGYANLATYLWFAGFKTLFTGLLAGLALQQLQSAANALASLRIFAIPGFFQRHGRELLRRLRHLAALAVLTVAALYLTVAWHLFDTVGTAWHRLISAGFDLNGTTISTKTVLTGLAALYLAVLFSWLTRSLLEEEIFPRRQIDRGVRDSINKLLHYALLALGVLLALSLAGIDLRNFAVLAGALGIGIGFGLQNVVNNFVSGLILLFERPIKIGDMVVLGDEWGEVRKIGLRSTTIETFDQSEVIVPNSILVSEKVTNWTLSNEQCRIVVPVGVAYGSDIEKVLRILYEAARQHPKVLDAPPPSAIFTSFGSSSLDFELRVWAGSVSERLLVKSDLLLFIDRRFREEGIEIPFPQRDLHLRSVENGILEQCRTADDRPASSHNL